MGQLSGFSYRDVIKKLKKTGFVFLRQAKGSHEIWQHSTRKKKITVPHHKPLKEGTLHVLVKDADLSVSEFLEL